MLMFDSINAINRDSLLLSTRSYSNTEKRANRLENVRIAKDIIKERKVILQRTLVSLMDIHEVSVATIVNDLIESGFIVIERVRKGKTRCNLIKYREG